MAMASSLPDAAWDASQDSDALLSELLDEATNETDALLAELLGDEPTPVVWNALEATPQLLLQAPSPPQPSAPKPRSPPTLQQLEDVDRTLAKRSHTVKHTLNSLRHEVSQLTSTLKRLQSECNIPEPHVRSAMEAATAERLKRRRVEDECKQLRDAVYAQTQFLRGLRSVFSTPMALSAMDLSQFLHHYTRLPRDRSTRWNEYAALAQEARLQSAMDILCRETRGMTVSDDADGADYFGLPSRVVTAPSLSCPSIQTELLKHSDGFGVTSTSVYALETNDLSAALRGVCLAVREIVERSQSYECSSLKRQIVDPDALTAASSYSSILYRVMGVRHKSPRDTDELAIESRIVTLYKHTDDYAVVLWDFVDDDELHPENETTDITRQAVGACLIRRETCDDGVERTVCRAMRTRRYRFHAHSSQEVLRRFEYLIASTMKANDLVFRQIVLDSIAKEEAAYAQALQRLEAVA